VKRTKKPAKKSTRTLTISEAADELSVSVESIRNYIERGCPHDKNGPGKANTFDATEVAAWMRKNNLTGEPGRPTTAASEDLESVRIRKETAMAVNWEHRNKEIEGVTVNKDEYRRHWMSEIVTIKNKCRGLGASIAPGCVGRDAGEIQGIIDGRVEQIFRELSE
jgi:hypothetical protein